ncbi:MAG: STAS domain-containing protein [Armatimonadetes bacterium]|nr:STAS domain-containing protein [Armatimonadota bacterium]
MDKATYDFKVTPGNKATTLQLIGEVDYAAFLEIHPKLRELTKECPDELLLALDAVTFLDSEGVKLLISAFQWMADRNGHAKITRCSPCVERILSIVKMGDLLPTTSASDC